MDRLKKSKNRDILEVVAYFGYIDGSVNTPDRSIARCGSTHIRVDAVCSRYIDAVAGSRIAAVNCTGIKIITINIGYLTKIRIFAEN